MAYNLSTCVFITAEDWHSQSTHRHICRRGERGHCWDPLIVCITSKEQPKYAIVTCVSLQWNDKIYVPETCDFKLDPAPNLASSTSKFGKNGYLKFQRIVPGIVYYSQLIAHASKAGQITRVEQVTTEWGRERGCRVEGTSQCCFAKSRGDRWKTEGNLDAANMIFVLPESWKNKYSLHRTKSVKQST